METRRRWLMRGHVGGFAAKRKRPGETGLAGWGGRIRTSEWRNQNPLPYHLATPQSGIGAVGPPRAGRTITADPFPINDRPAVGAAAALYNRCRTRSSWSAP